MSQSALKNKNGTFNCLVALTNPSNAKAQLSQCKEQAKKL